MKSSLLLIGDHRVGCVIGVISSFFHDSALKKEVNDCIIGCGSMNR